MNITLPVTSLKASALFNAVIKSAGASHQGAPAFLFCHDLPIAQSINIKTLHPTR